MGDKTDELKGRAKEAAGAVKDDDKLRNEGRADQVKGTVKKHAEKAAEKISDKTDDLEKKVKERT